MRNKTANLKGKSVLKMMKGHGTKQMTFTAPLELAERFEAQKKEFEKHGYTLAFGEICCDAMEAALLDSVEEMNKVLKSKAPEYS